MRTRLACLLLFVLASLSLIAQSRPPAGGPPGGGGGFGGGNRSPSIPGTSARSSNREVRVDIQVTDESSRPLNNMQLMVELGSLSGPQQRSYLDTNGRVTFSVPGGTTYRLTVTGSDIETASSTFEIYPDEMSHRENIEVKFKQDAAARAPGGMVSAADLKIPAKARNEFSKGMQEMNQSRWESAKKHFERAIQEYPKYDWAYNNLGVVDIRLKDQGGAKAAFTKAVELNEKNADATSNLAQLKLNDNDAEGAKSLLRKSLIVDPRNGKILLLLAIAQYQTNEFDAALATAEKVHQGDPDQYPLAHFIAAKIHESRGDRAGAERQYQAYLKEAPDGPQASAAKEALVRAEAKK